jgi:hypothetical protein
MIFIWYISICVLLQFEKPIGVELSCGLLLHMSFFLVSASMFKVSFLFSGLICPSSLCYRNTVHVVWLLRLQVSTACKVAVELYVTAHACPRFFPVPNFWASVFTGLCFFQKGLALCQRKDEMSDSFSISARARLFPPCVGLLWNGSIFLWSPVHRCA